MRVVFEANVVVAGVCWQGEGWLCLIRMARRRDERDDPYLVAALAGKAEVIVTYDHDLLDLGRPFGISIVRPARFLAIGDAGLMCACSIPYRAGQAERYTGFTLAAAAGDRAAQADDLTSGRVDGRSPAPRHHE